MTTPNSSEGTNENSENKKKEISPSKLFQAQRDFISIQLSENPRFTIRSKDIQDTFIKFLNGSEYYNDMSSEILTYEDDQKSNLEKQIRGELVRQKWILQQDRNQVFRVFDSEYNFSRKEGKLLANAVNNTDVPELKKILTSPSARNTFLQQNKIFWDQPLKMKDVQKEFDALVWKVDFSNITNSQQAALEAFLKNKNSMSAQEIQDMLSIFNTDNQIKILQQFNRSFQIKDLIEYGVFTRAEAKKLIEKRLKTLARENSLDIESISSDISRFDDMYIDISDIPYKNVSAFLASPVAFKKFIEEINTQKSEIRKDMYGDFYSEIVPEWPNEDINASFIDFIQSPSNRWKIDEKVRASIHNLQKGWYIKLSQSTDGNSVSDGYYKIEAVDVGSILETKTLQLKNIWYDGGVRKESEVSPENMTYTYLYDIFIADGKQKNTTVEILSEEWFNALWLREVVTWPITSIADLQSKLDSIDPHGADIPFTWWSVSIYDTSLSPAQSFQVSDISDTHITLESWWRKQKMSLEDFYDAFESKWDAVKRFPTAKSFQSSKDIASQLGITALEKVDIHSWGKNLVLATQKDTPIDKTAPIEFFIGDSGDAIKIQKISDSHIEYTLGEIKEWQGKSKKDKVFKWHYKSSWFNDFLLDIKTYNMAPDSTNAYETMEYEQDDMNLKSWFFWKLFSGISLQDIILWWNQIIDGFKSALERGDKLKAAQFAHSVSKYLPITKNMKLELQAFKEKTEKSTIEEMKDDMKWLGSKDLIIKVRWILERSSSQEYEIIACLFTVAEKYGELYPKWLSDLSNTHIWFRRLGGDRYPHIVSELRKEVDNPEVSSSGKAEAINFTEDELIFRLLSARSDDGTIRSKINKDYRWAFNSWIEDEIKDGEEKVAEHFTGQWKIDHVVWELKNRWIPNAIGWMEKLFKKNGDAISMQACPFIFTFCGIGTDLAGPLKTKILWLAMSTPYASLWFALSPENIKLYQQTLIRVFEKKGKKTEASKLKSILASTYKDRPEALSNFWKEHGKEVVNIITFKDPYIFLHKDEEPYFERFFSVMNGFLWDSEHKVDKEELEAWVYKKNPTVFAGSYDEVGKSEWWGLELITGDQWYGFWNQGWQKIVEMYFAYFKDLKNNTNLSDNEKKKVFFEIFPKLENALRLSLRWSAKEAFEKYPWAPLPNSLRINNLDLFRGDWAQAKRGVSEYDEFLEKTWNMFYFSRGGGSHADNIAQFTATTFSDILSKEDRDTSYNEEKIAA